MCTIDLCAITIVGSFLCLSTDVSLVTRYGRIVSQFGLLSKDDTEETMGESMAPHRSSHSFVAGLIYAKE